MYVGQSQNILSRLGEHFKKLERDRKRKRKNYKKYGFKTFKCIILEYEYHLSGVKELKENFVNYVTY